MELYERNTCSFVVKVWVENSDNRTDSVLWRGYITHIASGRRQYFEKLSNVLVFIVPYLEVMGIKID